MKPLIKYRGGKSKEIINFEKHIPNFKGRYVEPFFGGGALYFYLEPKKAIISDINSKLTSFYQAVQNDFQKLKYELTELEDIYKKNRSEFDKLKALNPLERVPDANEKLYYEMRDMFNGKALQRYSEAAIYFFINKTAYSGMIRYNSKGEFNVPYGRYANFNTSLVTNAHHYLLQGAQIFNTDYKNVFDITDADDFVFLDPPYDCIFSDYGNEEHKDGFGVENHRALASDFMSLNCRAMMVISRTPLTEELYSDNIIDEYEKNYAVNIRNRFKSAASHIVVTNYKSKSAVKVSGLAS